HHGPWDGGDGPDRAWDREGGRRDLDRGDGPGQEDGGDGGGDVPEAAGRGQGRRQRGPAASWGGEGRHPARAGAGEDGHDHAAHEVQGGSVRADEGRGRASHAVLRRVPAAVLLPYDGRDGCGAPAGGSGDGDAG